MGTAHSLVDCGCVAVVQLLQKPKQPQQNNNNKSINRIRYSPEFWFHFRKRNNNHSFVCVCRRTNALHVCSLTVPQWIVQMCTEICFSWVRVGDADSGERFDKVGCHITGWGHPPHICDHDPIALSMRSFANLLVRIFWCPPSDHQAIDTIDWTEEHSDKQTLNRTFVMLPSGKCVTYIILFEPWNDDVNTRTECVGRLILASNNYILRATRF